MHASIDCLWLADLFDFLDLLVKAANHVVGAIRDFLQHHQGNKWIDLSIVTSKPKQSKARVFEKPFPNR